MWDVEVGLAEEWLLSLADDDYDLIIAALEVLQDAGPMLGRPLADTIKGSRHKKMKGLRSGSGGRSEIRILFAFDPLRSAILLIAGDKSRDWTHWYKRHIPVADQRFDDHLKTHRRRG